MYFNTDLIKEKGYIIDDCKVLQLISQNRFLDESVSIAENITDRQLDLFYEKELVKEIKGTKKQNQFQKMRLTSKGKKLLEDFQTWNTIENDLIVFDWLKNLYKKRGKEIGSEQKCKELIAWFRVESGIAENSLLHLCRTFVSDDDRMEYSKVLQYIFWRSENHFQTKPKLSESKLWLYYEKYREKFDKDFEKLENGKS